MLELLRRIRYCFHREDFERELEEEMRHHLALKAQEDGMGPQFGNVTLLREESRAMWNFNFIEQILQDIRYAARSMRANPLFTAAAVLSLALGIGANTAIYSFMDAILMRALPVQHPEQLAIFQWRAKSRPPVVRGINGSSRGYGAHGSMSPNFPFAAFERMAAATGTLSTLIGYHYSREVNLSIDNQPSSAGGVPVTGNYFSGLGVPPAAGRLIGPDDDRAGAPLIAVLSYDYWKRRFHEDPAAVGKTILANNMPLTIAGVAAPGFFGLDPGTHAAFFFPLHSLPLFEMNPKESERNKFFDEHSYWLEMTARLRPGVTIEQAQAVLAPRFRQYVESTAASERDKTVYPELWIEPGSSGLDSLRQQYSEPLRVLMTMVALILTIACANLANLLLARAAARRREMAVRLSLGAGRWRIVRQLLTESVLLGLMGGALGLAFAYLGIQGITWLIANGRDNFTLHAQLNWPVLGFTLVLSFAAGLLFGLAPALQATKLDLTPALKASKQGDVARRGWASKLSATRALVAAQIAISLMLAIGASLFVRNLVNLNSIDLGFNRESVLVFPLNPHDAGYKGEAVAQFLDGVRDRIRELPGVRDVGLSGFPLVAHYVNSSGVILPGQTTPQGPSVDLMDVDQNLLRTMQIPIVLGRGIEVRDLRSPNVAVVNQQFVSKLLGGGNSMGQHFSMKGTTGDFEIVGVARNAHYNSIQEEIPSVAYLPYTYRGAGLSRMYFDVRTAGNPLAIVNSIREIVHQASPAVTMGSVNTEARIISQTIGQQRTFADLGSCFAVLALLIACVGLYGAMAYTVARRTSEIGIRMALGAKRGAIIWMVMREVLALAAVGLALGYGAARQTAHWIASFLFGMKPNDPRALALSIGILLAASLIAGFLPAWRAARIHPMSALRNE